MKRRISLVIALFVSFLLMFSPIAGADETKTSYCYHIRTD
jgi:hypothetical protein